MSRDASVVPISNALECSPRHCRVRRAWSGGTVAGRFG
jgi:hypothetical protein